MRRRIVVVPRIVDEENHNAQNLNAKSLLARFDSDSYTWVVTHYGRPDSAVLNRRNVRLVRLWPHRFWTLRMWLLYLQAAHVLFYPGVEAIDLAGVRWRKALYRRRPIVATLEGLAGTEATEMRLTQWAGHPVYCQRVDIATLSRVEKILELADHVIAISPFLADWGRHRYGEKFSYLPLGIDTAVFYPAFAEKTGRKRVVAAGRLEMHKRPELFLAMAERMPEADFVWYGDGSMRHTLSQRAATRGMSNVSFPGGLPPARLAEEFRRADVLAIPSKSEGVPKVSQEAAACGLPVVLFGYYESPTVKDGVNGFVAWNDEQFVNRVAELLVDSGRASMMGQNGARLGKEWDWDALAPKWESTITGVIGR